MPHPSDDRRPPGGANQTAVRNLLRVAGPILVVGGVVAVVAGFVSFMSGMNDVAGGPGGGSMVAFGLGGLAVVVGTALSGAGYQGAVSRFSAGEQAPVLKDTAHYLSDGDGLLGVGRTRSDGTATADRGGDPAAGPYCRRCGTRNDGAARFCDSCGESLA